MNALEDFKRLWGDALPSSSSLEEEKDTPQQETPTKEVMSVENFTQLWQNSVDTSKTKTEEEVDNIETSSVTEDELELITNPHIGQQVGAMGINFLEELIFGWNFSDYDDRVQLHPIADTVSEGAGMIANMLALGAGAKAVSGVVAGASWVSKATRGANKGVQILSNISPMLGNIGRVGAKGIGVASKAGLEGLLVSGANQIFSPEDRKFGLEGTSYMVAQYVGGDLGQEVAGAVLKRFFPKTGAGIELAIRFVGDAVGGPLMAYQHYENIEGMTKDMFAADVIAIGLVNVITYNIAKGKVKTTPEMEASLEKLDRAYADFDTNKTEVNQADVFKAIEELMATVNPLDSPKVMESLIREFEMDLDLDITRTVEQTAQAKEAGLERTPDVERNPDIEHTPDIERNPEFESLAETLINEGERQVTPERAEFLEQATPAKDDVPINTRRLETSAETRDFIMETGEVVKNTEVRSQAETLRRADALLEDIESLSDMTKEAQRVLEQTPEITVANRQRIIGQADNILAEAKRIKSLGADVTDVELEGFGQVLQAYSDLLYQHLGITTSVARTLNIMNKEVTGVDTRRFLETTPEKVPIPDNTPPPKKTIIDVIDDIVNTEGASLKPEGTEAVAKAETFKRKLGNALIELRIANLLGNISTWSNNVVSQSLNMVNEITTNYSAAIATAVGRVEGGMTFREAHARSMGELTGMYDAIFKPVVSMGELARIEASALGEKPPTRLSLLWDRVVNPQKFESLMEGSAFTTRLSVEGQKTPYISSEYLFPNAPDTPLINIALGALDWAGSQVRLLGFSGVEFTDRPFASGGYYDGLFGEIQKRVDAGLITNKDASVLRERTLAWREYTEIVHHIESLERVQGTSFDNAEMKKLVREATGGKLEGLTDADFEVLADLNRIAMEQSDLMTYKNDLDTPLLQDFEKMRSRSPLLRWLVPFYHTPAKLMENWWQKSPLSSQLWGDILGKTMMADGVTVDRHRQTKAIGQLSVSLSLYLTGASLWANGNITPTARNADERRRMQEAGMPENSILIGDTWIPIGRFDPTSTYLTTMANMGRIFAEADTPEAMEDAMGIFGDVLLSMMYNVTSETWMTSIREGLDVFTSGNASSKTVGRYLASEVGTLNPLQVQFNNATRYSMGGLNPLHQDYLLDINWLELSTRPRLDTFGKPVMNYQELAGLRYNTPTESPIRQEIVDLGISLRKIPWTWQEVKLTDDQHYEVTRYLDTVLNIEEIMNEEVIASKAYKEASYELKVNMIQSNWKALTDSALNAVLYGDDEFVEEFDFLEASKQTPEELKYKYKWFEEQRRNR